MRDHMMDTSEAPKTVLREGLNGDHVMTTTLETSVPTNSKIVNVTASTAQPHNPQIILPNHVTPVPLSSASTPSSSSSSTYSSTLSSSTSSSVRALNLLPQIPVTQIQVPSPSQNQTQISIPNNVFPRMECAVQKPTLVLTHNSIIRHENHIVNHYPTHSNNPPQRSIPISLAQSPPVLSQQNIIHQNHIITQNQVSIANFGHQPQPLSVITPVIGTSVIQTVSSSIQTPVTSVNVSHQQATPIVRPPVITAEANSAALRIQPNEIIPLTTHSKPSSESSPQNAATKAKEEEKATCNAASQDDSSDTDMEIKSLDLSSRVNIIDPEKAEKDRERPMSWEGELSDLEIHKNGTQALL